MARQRKHFYEFGAFRVDADDHLLLRDGERVPLAPMVFNLLLILIRHPGQVLERAWLNEQVWGNAKIGDPNDYAFANLNVYIATLRKALGDDPNQPRYIETIPRIGYRFIADVSYYYHFVSYYAPPLKYSPAASVAVLPFKQLNDSDRDRPLEKGIAATLIPKLSDIGEIRALQLDRVCGYFDRDQDPLAVGRDLQAHLVLTGVIQSANDSVRVIMQLIRVRDERQLWTGTFDEKFTGILSVQDAICEQAIAELARHLRMAPYADGVEVSDPYR
jgi:DNA-binding winged helix-turn-helix (wHTH) protein